MRRGLGLLATDAAVRVVAQVDGHLKQPVPALQDLVAVVERMEADLVVADRYAFQDLSGQTHRRALVHALRAIITGLTSFMLSDTASGMRAYSAEVARRFATELRAFGYGLEFEQLLLAAAWGARVSEVGVPSRRQADATNAEKHEDGFAALCLRARDVGATPEQQELLCSYLFALKERRDFVLDFPGSIRKVLMAYVGDTEEEEDAYSAVFLDEVVDRR